MVSTTSHFEKIRRRGKGTAQEIVDAARKDSGAVLGDASNNVRNLSQLGTQDIAQVSRANLTDRVLGTTNSLLELPNTIFNFGVLPLMVVGGVVGKFFPKTGKALHAPVDFINQPFDQLGEKTRLKKPVGGAIQWIADTAGRPIEWVTKKAGIDGRQFTANTEIAKESLSSAKKLAADIDISHFAPLHAIHQAVNKASTAAEISHLAPALYDASKILEGKHPTIVLPKDITLPKGTTELIASAKNAVWHHNRAQDWLENKAIRNAPKVVAKASMGHTVWNASFVGMSALSMFASGRAFLNKTGALAEMYKDITGQKNVSSFQLWFGKVPEPVAAARSNSRLKFGMEEAVQTAGLLFSIKQALGGHFTKKAMAGQMGLMFGAPVLMSLAGDSLLDIYTDFKTKQQHGQATIKDYVSFLGIASKELRLRGGVDNAFTTEVAKIYADKNATASEVFKAIENGEVLQHINAISTKFEATHPHGVSSGGQGKKALAEKELTVMGTHTMNEKHRRDAQSVTTPVIT